MPTKTLSINKDALVAINGSLQLGAGQERHLPLGISSGYTIRALLQFNLDWSSVTAINSATLYLKTDNQTHMQYGASARFWVQRCTAAWTEGTYGSDEIWYAANAVNWANQPATTTTNQKDSGTVSHSANTWIAVDITAIVRDWAPASVGGNNLSNFGIKLFSFNEGSSADNIEFYSREGGYPAYIVLNYSSNGAPLAPSVSLAPQGVISGATNPTVSGDFNDSTSDVFTAYQIQVATDSGFASIVWDTGTHATSTSEQTARRFSLVYAGTALSRGSTYYWRAKTEDNGGLWSPWSGTQTFTVNQLPTASTTKPANGGLAAIWNLQTDLNVWNTTGSWARPTLAWSYSDPNGNSQGSYRVRIYSALTGGTLLFDSGQVSGTATSVNANLALVYGTQYWWTIQVWDSIGESPGESARAGFKVRWGQAIYEYAVGASSSSWAFTASSPDPSVQQGFLFATATAAGGTGRTAWTGSISTLAPAAYLNVMVRLATSVSGTQPKLYNMTFSYIGNGIDPDIWYLGVITPSDWMLDSAVHRYGTQSLKCQVSTTTGDRNIYPGPANGTMIPVTQNTDYVFSAWIKTNGQLSADSEVTLEVWATTGLLASGSGIVGSSVTNTTATSDGWQRITLQYHTPSGVSQIQPNIIWHRHSSAVATDIFWVDAVKLEEGTVATAWTPGFVADAVVLDANGIAIDAVAGGIFRLRASLGGTENTVQLGSHGLIFGTGTELYASGPGVLVIGAPSGTGNEGAELDFGGSPSFGYMWHTDVFQDMFRIFGDSTNTTAFHKDGSVALPGLVTAPTMKSNRHYARVRANAAWNIAASNVATAVPLDTVVDDSDAFWASGTPTRLTVPVGLSGIYTIEATIGPGAIIATGNRIIHQLFVNGLEVQEAAWPSSGVANTQYRSSFTVPLADNDYVEVKILQPTASAVAATVGNLWSSVVTLVYQNMA